MLMKLGIFMDYCSSLYFRLAHLRAVHVALFRRPATSFE